MRQPLFIASLLLAATSFARADVVDIQWSGDGRFAYTSTIAAGKFAEVCGKLPAGLKVDWDFEASTPLEFNIHYHLGKEVMFPSKLSAIAAAKDTLDAKIAQDYCWMWSNKSAAPATLTVNLNRR